MQPLILDQLTFFKLYRGFFISKVPVSRSLLHVPASEQGRLSIHVDALGTS